eukprot:Awhi_evm1s2585
MLVITFNWAYGQLGLDDSISVGSTTFSINPIYNFTIDALANHSNHGDCVSMLAPGVNLFYPIYSEREDGSFADGSGAGTSY